MRIGYMRVSTQERDSLQQGDLMERLGVEKVFIDKASGKSKDRDGLSEMFAFAREGDIVVVESINRFARNTKDFLSLLKKLADKSIAFVSKDGAIDTTTDAGKHMMAVFGELEQLDRDWAKYRRAEGIAVAKVEGKYAGRKPLDIPEDALAEQYWAWKRGETAPRFAMKKLGISRTTFYRRVEEYEQKHGITPSSESGDTGAD